MGNGHGNAGVTRLLQRLKAAESRASALESSKSYLLDHVSRLLHPLLQLRQQLTGPVSPVDRSTLLDTFAATGLSNLVPEPWLLREIEERCGKALEMDEYAVLMRELESEAAGKKGKGVVDESDDDDDGFPKPRQMSRPIRRAFSAATRETVSSHPSSHTSSDTNNSKSKQRPGTATAATTATAFSSRPPSNYAALQQSRSFYKRQIETRARDTAAFGTKSLVASDEALEYTSGAFARARPRTAPLSRGVMVWGKEEIAGVQGTGLAQSRKTIRPASSRGAAPKSTSVRGSGFLIISNLSPK